MQQARAASAPSSAQASSIDAYLRDKGSPLAGQGEHFVRAGERYGIDPRFLVAISGQESSFGENNYRRNNAWGWGGMNFDSYREGIDTVARGLKRYYVDEGLTSVAEIQKKYCPVGADNDPTGLNVHWRDGVTKFLREQGGDPADVTA